MEGQGMEGGGGGDDNSPQSPLEGATPRRRNSFSSATGSLADIESSMQRRGLAFLRHEKRDSTMPVVKKVEGVDEKAEAERDAAFFDELAREGLRWHVATPFQQAAPTHPQARHASQAFFFALRFTTASSEAKLLHVNAARVEAEFVGSERVLKTRSLHGVKAARDVVSKEKFQILFKGDKLPVDNTVYSEGYRDIILYLLRAREAPKFSIVCIHQGVVEKRGRSGLTYKPRFIRLVCGALLVYRSPESIYPLDSIGILRIKLEDKGSRTFAVSSRERKYVFKAATEEEKVQWMRAIDIGRKRGAHEHKLLEQAITFQRLEQAKKHAEKVKKMREEAAAARQAGQPAPLGLVRGASVVSGFSSFDDLHSVRERHSARIEDELDSNADVLERKSEFTDKSPRHMLSPRGPGSVALSAASMALAASMEMNGGGGGGGGGGGRLSETVANAGSEFESLHARAGVRPRRASSFYDGGSAEFEVRVVADDGRETAIGFIDVDNNDTLVNFRAKIFRELDNVPDDFVFLRDGVPVGRRQEHIKSIQHVVLDDVVTLRAVTSDGTTTAPSPKEIARAAASGEPAAKPNRARPSEEEEEEEVSVSSQSGAMIRAPSAESFNSGNGSGERQLKLFDVPEADNKHDEEEEDQHRQGHGQGREEQEEEEEEKDQRASRKSPIPVPEPVVVQVAAEGESGQRAVAVQQPQQQQDEEEEEEEEEERGRPQEDERGGGGVGGDEDRGRAKGSAAAAAPKQQEEVAAPPQPAAATVVAGRAQPSEKEKKPQGRPKVVASARASAVATKAALSAKPPLAGNRNVGAAGKKAPAPLARAGSASSLASRSSTASKSSSAASSPSGAPAKRQQAAAAPLPRAAAAAPSRPSSSSAASSAKRPGSGGPAKKPEPAKAAVAARKPAPTVNGKKPAAGLK
jgi:hypothetical protein